MKKKAISIPVAQNDNQKNQRQCAICVKPMSDKYRPFCSKRCADIDLSRWLGGVYAIAGQPALDDEEARPASLVQNSQQDQD